VIVRHEINPEKPPGPLVALTHTSTFGQSNLLALYCKLNQTFQFDVQYVVGGISSQLLLVRDGRGGGEVFMKGEGKK